MAFLGTMGGVANVFTWVFMDQDSILSYYTQFAEEYDETIARDQDYVAYQKIPAWVLEQLSAPPCTLLDLGCGTGLVAKPFITRGDHVTGVDLTPKMLEKAALLGYQHLICHSLDQPLPLLSAHFDAAFLIGVMEFIQRPFALFKEIRRLLRDGGWLACTLPEPLPASIETLIGIRTYSTEVMEAFFTHVGFSIARRERFQGFISHGHSVPYVGYLLRASHFSAMQPPLANEVLAVREIPHKGRGVFATQAIAQGSWIERAPLLVLSAREWEQIASTCLYDYAFEWGPDGHEAALALGYGSLYNHATAPNSYYIRRAEERVLDFFALRDIQAGEELLINYNGEPSCQDRVWFEALE